MARKFDIWKDAWNIVHVHDMRLNKMPDSGLRDAPFQAIKKRLVRINGMNEGAEFLCQDHCLTTCSATGVNDDAEALFWKKA